jgi:hypothetical protein
MMIDASPGVSDQHHLLQSGHHENYRNRGIRAAD